MKRIRSVALLCGLLLSSAVHAHHSFAMFDMNREVTLKGTVKEIQWENPHVWIQILVPATDGSTQEWSVETMGPGVLFKQLGWNRDSLKAGDKVVARIHPLWSGKNGGSLMSLDGPKGTLYGLPRSDPNVGLPANDNP